MAITITQSPKRITSAYNPIIYIVSSTNVAQTNFRFVCDVYDSSGVTLLARIKKLPNAANRGIFDVSIIIQTYVTNAAVTGLGTSFATVATQYDFIIKFGEEYGSTPTLFPNLTTSTTVTALNASLGHYEFIELQNDNYLQDRILSDAPLIQKVRVGDWLNIYATTDGSGNFGQVDIAVFNAAGGQIGSTITKSSGSTTLGEIGFKAVYGTDIPATANDAYITFDFAAQGGDVYRFDVQCEAYGNDIYRLIWLNRFGGFDAFNFTKASEARSEVQKEFYKRPIADLSGTTWGYTSQRAVELPFGISERQQITVQSDWLSQDENEWLSGVITSPLVYLQGTSATDLQAVKVIDTEIVKGREVPTKLFNTSFTIEFPNNKFQRQ